VCFVLRSFRFSLGYTARPLKLALQNWEDWPVNLDALSTFADRLARFNARAEQISA
jgi:hypothetical protein